MDARPILQVKRDGGVLREEQMRDLLAGYLSGEVPETLIAAFTALVFAHGMQPAELAAWTRCMLATGESLRFEGLDGPVVDKHSTGGVGDKVSLPLAPALAACGAYVPMISGRGLGHTGGTLDKLEAIPGIRTDLSLERIQHVVRDVGAVIAAQTEELVPADRRLYSLRDETGLVESIPLIASSILSKKLAEGLDALVLDVKYGGGSFLPDPEDGLRLAETMLSIAKGCGLRASVLQTAMHAPLGQAVGHALEVRESLACLRGEGPDDLRALVIALGGELLSLAGLSPDAQAGAGRIAASLDDGTALQLFARMIEAQGGDPRCAEDEDLLPSAPRVHDVHAAQDGYLQVLDCRAFGHACTTLGGGRTRSTDRIDMAVGVEWLGEDGARVESGMRLARLHYREESQLQEALEWLDRAWTIESESVKGEPQASVGSIRTVLR